jgi:branched-subunit amino acid aminotransferase/4-amino-4-deoxychorismate lyase
MIKNHKVIEKTITKKEFYEAEKIYLSNSINGFIEVKLR